MQPSKIAILGANGFVGGRLLQMAVQSGSPVLGVVRSDRGAAFVRQQGGVALQIPDLEGRQTSALASALSGCEGLVYTAGVSTGSRVADRTDPSGLVNVIDACRSARVPRIVFFSGLGTAQYGLKRHCTNPYFLAKLAGEVALFRSGLDVVVLRPSYIFGPGDEFLSPLISRMSETPRLEIPGDGEYRLQPISVDDAARVCLGALAGKTKPPAVVDLVGPEVVTYRGLIERVAEQLGKPAEISSRPTEEAEAMARASDYFGLRPHDLACLLCDEVSDPSSARSLAGGSLESLETMILRARAPRASQPTS